MGDKSKIEWTDATWNPVVGCQQVSPGCDHCYAKTLHDRRHNAWKAETFPECPEQYKAPFETVQTKPERLTVPLRWRGEGRRVFVNSVSDLFHADVPEAFIDQVFGVMAACPRHTFQILTKRPQRLKRYLNDPQTKYRMVEAAAPLVQQATRKSIYDLVPAGADPEMAGVSNPDWVYAPAWPLPNVWLGVSVESNAYVFRAEMLRQTPAAVRFISAEPLLGKLDGLDLGGIDWLIAGGESGGPGSRSLVEHCPHGYVQQGVVDWPRDACPQCNTTGWRPKVEALSWVRDLRDRATAAGVAFLFKQWGGVTSKSGGRLLDGLTWDQYPAVAE